MRILVDLPEADVAALDRLADRLGKSRAATIRDAVSQFLSSSGKSGIEAAFGLWKDRDAAGGEGEWPA